MEDVVGELLPLDELSWDRYVYMTKRELFWHIYNTRLDIFPEDVVPFWRSQQCTLPSMLFVSGRRWKVHMSSEIYCFGPELLEMDYFQ